jgi:hypothetical protein
MAFSCPQSDNILRILILEDRDAISRSGNRANEGEKGAVGLVASR